MVKRELRINYRHWLSEINESNSKYRSLFVEEKPYPPIFFFGDLEGAVVATVGVNPSAREFSIHRKWDRRYGELSHLLDRCRNYFHKPAGVPSHPWFQVWEDFLAEVGVSYCTLPRAVHLDFSPRATRSMSSLQRESEQLTDLFLDLVENDLKYFIEQLRACPSIKHLYVAGAVTKKYYGIEFLEKNSGSQGYTLKPVMSFRRGGPGQVGLYKLDLGDAIPRYFFFCSTSPSARVIPHPLPQKARWLKKHYPEFLLSHTR